MTSIFLTLAFALTVDSANLEAAQHDAVSEVLKRKLAVDDFSINQVAIESKDLQRFYALRDYRPIWLNTLGVDQRIHQLVDVLNQASREGLKVDSYAIAETTARLDAILVSEQADLELLASHALLRYVSDVRTGRLVLHEIDPELFIHSGDLDPLEILERAAAAEHIGKFLRNQAPSNPIYRRLRRVLAEFRNIAVRGGWPTVPDGPSLKPAAVDVRVPVLKQRPILS